MNVLGICRLGPERLFERDSTELAEVRPTIARRLCKGAAIGWAGGGEAGLVPPDGCALHRLDHRRSTSYECTAEMPRRRASRMTSMGAARPVKYSYCKEACRTNISMPEMVRQECCRASLRKSVFSGL